MLALGRDAGPPRLRLERVGFAELPGWARADMKAAVQAFTKSCLAFEKAPGGAPFGAVDSGVDYGTVGEWLPACHAAADVSAGDAAAARRFFEDAFVPMAVTNYGEARGLFTGYFEIELNGSVNRHGPYQTPIYRRPPELAQMPRLSRAEIEDGALAGRGLELFWVDDPIAAFFLQIEGSGVIRLHDGRKVRVGYDGQNGLPYVPVGRLLIERHVLAAGEVTMASIIKWMRAHPRAGAALRRDDPAYVFFRIVHGDGPIGAEHVPLTAEHSLAVDPRFIPLGVPIWLDAKERFDQREAVRRLVVAQDTGGAIKGPIRGDLFWGAGSVAGERAGRMNARGSYWLLLPRVVAARVIQDEAWD